LGTWPAIQDFSQKRLSKRVDSNRAKDGTSGANLMF
jgi:hypothetical protein